VTVDERSVYADETRPGEKKDTNFWMVLLVLLVGVPLLVAVLVRLFG